MRKSFLTFPRFWGMPIFLLVLSGVSAVFASNGHNSEGGGDIVHIMSDLVLQIGVILFASRISGILFEKLHMPSVIGELAIGIVIGPYILGSIPIPGYPNGFFPILETAGQLPVTQELYGIATVASIILLFFAGLETDLRMFLRFSVAGSIIGIGGVMVSFALGAAIGSFFLDADLSSSRVLFLGVISTATSVGITVRVLTSKRKMDSPSGVTMLAGAVIDDVLGIIILAVVLGASTVAMEGATAQQSQKITGIIIKALGVWLGFTFLGFIFAHRISGILKAFRSIPEFSILSLGLALMLAGIFEKAGLAMIIGAYVMGLTLSKTDLNYVIQETLYPLYVFFVPVFFTVMGMLVDVRELIDPTVIVFGLVYTLGAIFAKIVGCGVPALFFNFNLLGATRIGLGMVPRGEVALIIAGIGLSSGILDDTTFGVAIMMTLLTTVIAPPLLSRSLTPRKGTRKTVAAEQTVTTSFDFASIELTDLIEVKLLSFFRNEGFYVHVLEADVKICHLRKESTFITLYVEELSIKFETAPEDVVFVKTIMYEALLDLHTVIEKVKDLAKPASLKKDLFKGKLQTRFAIGHALDIRAIKMELKAGSKEEVIEELIDMLVAIKKIRNRRQALDAVFEREKTMSTGMQYGIALPHGKTDSVTEMAVAIGFKREGIDFQSLDGQPSQIFILVLSPAGTAGPHLQFLAGISSLLNNEESRNRLLSCRSLKEVFTFFVGEKKPLLTRPFRGMIR
ncbi:MAG: fructose PTS transporter subunit IIA [Fibrobacterota bacterium]